MHCSIPTAAHTVKLGSFATVALLCAFKPHPYLIALFYYSTLVRPYVYIVKCNPVSVRYKQLK